MLAVAFASIALLAGGRRAWASDCAATEGPWIAVTFQGGPWSATARAEVLAHLRAGLSRDALAICPEGTRPMPPIASVVLSRESSDSVALTIDVRDGVTEKRLVRDVDLSDVPSDAEPLGIALAADELLRASWVELALEKAPEPAKPPPMEVRNLVEEELERSPVVPRRGLELGVRGAFEHYGGGQDQLGGEIAVRGWFLPSLGVEVAFGARRALVVERPEGRVTGTAFGGSASLVFDPLPSRPVTLQLEAGPSLSQVRLEGKAADGSGVATSSGTAPALFLRGGFVLAWRPGRGGGLRLRAGAGAPLATVRASVDDRTATGVSGVEIFSGLEAHATF